MPQWWVEFTPWALSTYVTTTKIQLLWETEGQEMYGRGKSPENNLSFIFLLGQSINNSWNGLKSIRSNIYALFRDTKIH